eukprot:165091-Amphidinium_carterae.1
MCGIGCCRSLTSLPRLFVCLVRLHPWQHVMKRGSLATLLHYWLPQCSEQAADSIGLFSDAVNMDDYTFQVATERQWDLSQYEARKLFRLIDIDNSHELS